MESEERLASFDARELESRLYSYLAIPVPERSNQAGRAAPATVGPAQRDPHDFGLARLRFLVRELEQGASRIGRMPAGYPRHVTLIMRLISAALPWYTRPLVELGQKSSQTLREVSQVLEELARHQESLAAEVAGMKEAISPDAGGPERRA